MKQEKNSRRFFSCADYNKVENAFRRLFYVYNFNYKKKIQIRYGQTIKIIFKLLNEWGPTKNLSF